MGTNKFPAGTYRFIPGNDAVTALDSNIDANTTTIPLADDPTQSDHDRDNFPSPNTANNEVAVCTTENEIILYAEKSGNNLIVYEENVHGYGILSAGEIGRGFQGVGQTPSGAAQHNSDVEINSFVTKFEIEEIQDAIVSLEANKANITHADEHIKGGSDEVDGDQIDIDFTPSNYTPDTSPSEVTDADHLSAHLKGIDNLIGTLGSNFASNRFTTTATWSAASGLSANTVVQALIDMKKAKGGRIEVYIDSTLEETVYGGRAVSRIYKADSTVEFRAEAGTRGAVESSFTFAGSNFPDGMTIDDLGNLIVVEDNNDNIVTHDGISNTILSSYSGPNATMGPIAYNEVTGNIAIGGVTGGATVYIMRNKSADVLDSFSYPQSSMNAFEFIKGDLFVADGSAGKVFQFSGESSTVLTSFSFTGLTGIAYDKINDRILTMGTNAIYVYEGLTTTLDYSFSTDAASGAETSLVFDNEKMRIINNETTQYEVFIYESEMEEDAYATINFES